MGYERAGLVKTCCLFSGRPSSLLLVLALAPQSFVGSLRGWFNSQSLDTLHPGGGFPTIVCVRRMNQNQAMRASIGGPRELALILHHK